MIMREKLILSPYIDIYDIVVSKDHILRRIKNLVDFSFVDKMLADKYTLDQGRPGYRPQKMFKYLLLKNMFELSDRDLVNRAFTDMAFKYFLDLAPEDEVIDSSSLTKFRKIRLNDESIMDTLISKTVEIAQENGIVLSSAIIVDSTHSAARFNNKSVRDYLLDYAKKLRKKVYDIDATYVDKMPEKPNASTLGNYEDVVNYCQQIIDRISADGKLMFRQNIAESINMMQELVDDTTEELSISKDKDAKTGHKTADTNFFGYKTHIAMTPERIITAATVTSGEKADGKELSTLVEKTEANNVEVDTIIGDGAYSEKENIVYANNQEINLIAKLSKTVSEGNKRKSGDFEFNKDANRYICHAGHMSFKTTMHGKKKNLESGLVLRETHFFDVAKCNLCSLKEKCGFKTGQETKTYTVTIKRDTIHQDYLDKINLPENKELAKLRYMVEAKNGELKNSYGYENCQYSGFLGMHLQAAVSIFNVNIKRILTINSQQK